MHEFKFYRGTDEGAQDFANWIVDVYNEDSDWKEDHMSWKCPESILVFGVPGACGMVIDVIRHAHHEDEKLICHFIAVNKDLRGKGMARELVEIAQKLAIHCKTEFVGAYVQNDKEMKLWANLGFPARGNVGFTLTQTIRPMSEIWSNKND